MMKIILNKISKFSIIYLTIFTFILSLSLTFIILDNKPKEVSIVKNKNNYIITETNTNIIEELRKKYNNQDVIAKINIPNTSIDEPVMQSTDNNYYLSHGNDNNYNYHGSIYMDYRINPSKSKKILIYGHSSPADNIDIVPFNELEEYYNYNYYNNHKDIILTLDNEERQYKIFSVYVETSDFKYMNLNFEDINTWYNHILYLKSKSLYNTKIDINKEDEILILQTCSNNKKYTKYQEKYLLIIAKRIK